MSQSWQISQEGMKLGLTMSYMRGHRFFGILAVGLVPFLGLGILGMRKGNKTGFLKDVDIRYLYIALSIAIISAAIVQLIAILGLDNCFYWMWINVLFLYLSSKESRECYY